MVGRDCLDPMLGGLTGHQVGTRDDAPELAPDIVLPSQCADAELCGCDAYRARFCPIGHAVKRRDGLSTRICK